MQVPVLAAGALALLLGLATAACESEPPEVRYQREIAALKVERMQALDDLYKSYGQGELAEAIQTEAAEAEEEAQKAAAAEDKAERGKDVKTELLKAVGNAASEVDRAAFESHCETLGKGERPSVLSDRGKAFFARKETAAICLKIADQTARIAALERELKAAQKDK